MMAHPIEQFQPPRAITKGTPLKNLLDAQLVQLIAASFASVTKDFDRASFVRHATAGLAELELTPRAQQIGKALTEALPDQPEEALAIIIASLGPLQTNTEEIGLQPFFYLPHSHAIASLAPQAVPTGLDACYAITQRFTAEFCLRPLLLCDSTTVLHHLHQWTHDANPHVRRLVSEGTRPRLPWAPRLPDFIADPQPCLALLENEAICPIGPHARSW
jgi:hypothetical protein